MKNIYKTEKPAHLLRVFVIFSILSLIAILFIVNLGIHKILIQNHINEAEHDATGISQAIFEDDRAILTSDLEGEVTLNIKPEDFPEVDKSMLHFLNPLNIVKIKVFSKDGEIIYSTDHTIIGQIDANNEKLNRALNGEIVSKLEKKEEVWDTTGEQRFDIDVVETYLPVRDENQKIIGSFEVYLDISRYQEGTKKALRLSMTVVAVVLVLVFGFLFFIMRRGTNELIENEEMLKESEKKYEDLYENAPDMFLSVDAKTTKIIQCNQTLATALDYTKKEIIGRPVFDMYHPDSLESARKAFKSFVETGEVHNTEIQLKRKDGSKIDGNLNASSVRDKQGNILYSRSVLRDVTKRKQAEINLREEKNKFQSVVEAMTSGLTVQDKNFNIIYQNKILQETFGGIGEKCYKIYEGNEQICKGCPVEKAFKDGNAHTSERMVKMPSGEIGYWENTANIIKNGDGEIIACLEIANNITHRKKAEKKLTDAYQKLKETQEQLIQSGKMAAMGQLSAGISHELNQPLTGIKGFAQTVLMEMDENNPFKKDLQRIVEQADRMDKIIKHVRFFARKSDFRMKEIDINQPIEDSLTFLTQQLKTHNILINKSLGKNLPMIEGDSNQLEQVFINLITNARDAIDSLKSPDGGEITIQSALSKDKKNIEITFKDTGCGVSRENLNSIFNPFYTTKSPDGGMGLGLSIVYRIIEDHKGSIEVDSKEGRGTTLSIMLPIA